MFTKIVRKALTKAHKCDFSTLVIAEHRNSKLSSNFLKVLTAAKQINQETHVLVSGENLSAVTEALQKNYSKSLYTKIIVADHSDLKANLPDAVEHVVRHLIEKNKYTHVLTAATTQGKDFIPRLAAVFDSQSISDIISVEDKNTYKRPVYAGNAVVKVKSNDAIKFLSVRTTNFDAAEISNPENIDSVEKVDVGALLGNADNKARLAKHVKDELVESDRPELTAAKIVVSGGRGLKAKENFALLDSLAKVLGNAAVGASRAAVDAGFVSNDLQVGQTGKVVAPELYVAVGISGAIQHLAGMKDSKVIVAINKDPEAPIFQISNYGIVGDLFKIVPELTEKLPAYLNK